ncbi:putative quinol monooxygenase [Pedobacter sp. MR2016-24]|uniref:putative quinol monooxygenase n=1 Tax=Pedobacter sp. MR2016-24 TaxID=2994466 RepID=UPI0022481EC5|nr:putative quinol monooxygenase [Pedobacter sp. MR2016-24]MCX2484594.1 putative quinol monooxygenase [Pedobacter sp. MR2016-24]
MEREVIVKWRIKETETASVLKLLPELAEKTKKEKGNLAYAIYQSEKDPNEIILHERYVNEEALDAHKNAAHYQTIVAGKIIPHLEVREVLFVKPLF